MNISEITSPVSLKPVINVYVEKFLNKFEDTVKNHSQGETLKINDFMKENAPELLETIEKGVKALGNVAPEKEIDIFDVESVMNQLIQEKCSALQKTMPEFAELATAWDDVHQARMTHRKEAIEENVRKYQR